MHPIHQQNLKFLLKVMHSGIFLPVRSRGQEPVEFEKKAIQTIKIGKTGFDSKNRTVTGSPHKTIQLSLNISVKL